MYVRITRRRALITPPPVDLTADQAHSYLVAVTAELKTVFVRRRRAAMRRIDLSNGLRGGYFANAGAAITALLWEVVDTSRKAAGHWKAATA